VISKIISRFALLGILVLVGAGLAHADALHGFCVSPTPACSDNGAITPVASTNPVFGFWDAGGPITGVDYLAFLIPNNLGSFAPFTVHGFGTTFAASLFSATAWTAGQLDDYLFGAGSSVNPVNPIGAYTSLDPSATGFYVYRVNLGSRTITADPGTAPTFSLTGLSGGGLPVGTFIVDFVFPPGSDGVGTPNSAALQIVTPEPSSLTLLGGGLLMVGMLAFANKRRVTA